MSRQPRCRRRRVTPDTPIPHHDGLRGAVRAAANREWAEGTAQAAWRRMTGTRIGREPGPPTCEKGCVRQSRP